MNKAMEGEDRPGPRQGKAGPGLYPPPFLGPAPHTDMQFYQVIKATTVLLQFRHKAGLFAWYPAGPRCTANAG